MTKTEKLIKSKIIYFNELKTGCSSFFNKLKEIPSDDRFKTGKRLKLNKSDIEVSYDSPYEKKILEDLDKCDFIKKIKTQSLIIDYSPNIKKRKYFPDIELLLNDDRVVIIEVKPFKEMVNKHNLMKHKALEDYCKEKGFGFAILDQDYYSFEDLKNEKVSLLIQMKFIRFVKSKGEVSFEECNEFKEKYNLTDYQICKIILKNNKKIIYQQKLIKYNKV